MRLTPAQIRARQMLRRAPDGVITSADKTRIRRTTIEALARAEIVTLERTNENVVRKYSDGRTVVKTTVAWRAQLQPVMPTAEELAELDLIIKNGEGIIRADRRKHAAAYIARTMPDVALDGSPARKPQYNEMKAYREALEWPPAKLLDTVMMLRHMTGQTTLPVPAQRPISELTDVWALTEKTGADTPGRELGRVRASTQNAAALAGNSLLNRRGGYSMRRLHAEEIGDWQQDFRAKGLVLRLSHPAPHTFSVSVVATGEHLISRTTADEAKRDVLADLTSLYSALADNDGARTTQIGP